MNYTNFLLLGLALIFTLAMFPMPVSATTNVTVTSPNGGEVWGGTHNITWDFNDTTASQNIDFNLWYSNPSGANNFVIAQNLPFEDYCSVSTLNQWGTSDTNFLVGLPSIPVSATVNNVSTAKVGNITYLLISRQTSTVSNRHALYDWNGSSWTSIAVTFADTNSETWQNASGAGLNVSYSIYEKNGTLYLNAIGNRRSDATHFYFTYGAWSYSGGSFHYDTSEVSGLDTSTSIDKDACTVGVPRLFSAKIGSDYYLISTHNAQGSGCSNKFIGQIWNGSSWTRYTPMETFDSYNFGTGLTTFSPFNYNGNTYAFTEGINLAPVVYLWNGVSGWQVNNDLNNNLGFTTGNDRTINAFTISNNLYFLKSENVMANYLDTSNTFSFNLTKMFTTGSYNTNRAQSLNNCSYSWDTSSINNGAWFVDARAVGSTSATDSSNTSFSVSNYSSSSLPITPIQNISSVSYDSNVVSLSISNNSSDVIWSILNNTGSSVNVGYSLSNSDNSGSQYFVYTSTDGNSWTFSDTLTFGSTNSTPVQKIWNASTDTYDYSFSDTAVAGQTQYYKLVFQPLPIFWEVLKDSVDWANYNSPTSFSQSSGNHFYDLFADSNLSNIQSFTYKPYPQLTSTDLSAGFYVEFTGYASVASSLKVGYRVGSTDTVSGTVSLTTSPHRFAVFVQPNSNSAQILIKSISNTSANVYLSDYAIVPASYFVDRLDLVQALGGSLQSIVRDGVTYQYVKEGIGFKANTRFYNFNGELSSLVTTVSVSGVNVKTYSYDLSDYTQNGTISLSNLLDGVVDFNSQSQRIVGNNLVLDPLPDLIVTNTLINSAGESVAEQSQTVKLVQYPYSSGDIALNVYLLNRKVAESPSFSLNLIQAYPQSFVGLKFLVFDSSHDSNNPNYSETIYAGELGCVNKMYCQKNITIDKWSFPEATTYTVVVALLLTTEPQNLDNPLTKFEDTILATFTNFETGRVLQVFERRGDINVLHGEYNQSEEIPLVFQARNDKLENMQNQYAVSLSVRWLDVNFGAHDISVPFYPQKFVYDSVTGYNYWFFNQVLHDDAGDLLPDGSIVYTRANVTPIKGQGEVSYFGYTLKCTTYPSDFSDGSFLMNWIGVISDSTFGCTDVAPALNPMSDANSFVGDIVAQNTAYISATYVPVSNQNESVFCWNADVNVTYAPDIGNSFMCGVLYKKSEAQIDRFDVMLGNQYSDYSKTGDNAQFIKFSIPAEQVIFNDLAMMKNALVLTHNTQGIHTYGDFFSAVIDRLLPDWRIRGNINSANFPFLPPTFSFGADVNLAEELNPNVYDGAFVFRVNGVKVVNQYDYIKEFPELETVDPKEFRTFASANGLSVPIKQTAISLFSSDLSNLQNFKVNSPLVIFEAPRNSIKSVDGNSVAISNPPTSLKFDFIVDMFSNNLTQSYRAIVPLYLSYVVGSGTPFNFNTWLPDLWNGDNGLSTNPVGFATSNWFFFFVLMVMIILGAWVIGQTRR